MQQIDLFGWAYIPSWPEQLATLAEKSMPEQWAYKNPLFERKNITHHILEKYFHTIFRELSIRHTNAKSANTADTFVCMRREFCCFHTGLLSRRYRDIYAYFEKSKREGVTRDWVLSGFHDCNARLMRTLDQMPLKPFYEECTGAVFHAEWPIRVNVDHIMDATDTFARIPACIKQQPNLALILEVAVEQARRVAAYMPSIVVPQIYQGRAQFLLPLHFLRPEKPDLALTLEAMEGYYIGHTVLDLEMAYNNARLLAKPTTPWLTAMVE